MTTNNPNFLSDDFQCLQAEELDQRRGFAALEQSGKCHRDMVHWSIGLQFFHFLFPRAPAKGFP